MERCIRAVRAWLIVDKLKLNEDNSEFMLIGTRQQLSKVRTDSLIVGDTQVKSVSEARNLGVWFYSNFQVRSHINKTCQSAFFSLYNIKRIRKYLPFEAAKSLVQAFVISRIDYCNAILYGFSVLFRTTHTRTITLHKLLILLGSNHLLYYMVCLLYTLIGYNAFKTLPPGY